MGMPGAGPRQRLSLGAIALIVPLLAILAASVWLVARTWIAAAASPMPASAYVAMILGVVFSLVVGCGLMALVFYSSRHGYDERAFDAAEHRNDDPE
jgi:hypothetical protein